MAKLHWIVFVIVGIIFTFGSWMINRERFVLFFYAGFVFLLIGAIKIIYSGKESDASERGQKAMQQLNSNIQKKQHYLRPANFSSAAKIALSKVKYCHNCRAPSGINANFCHKCGARLA